MKKIMFNDIYGLTKAVIDGHKTMTRRFVPDRMAQLLDVGDKGVLIIQRSSIPDCMTPEQFAKEFAKYPGVITFGENDVKEVKPAIDIREECIKLAPYKVGEVVAVAQSYKSVFEESLNYALPRYHWLDDHIDEKGFENKMFVKASEMPHQIQITDVKIERLQDISEDDCRREGINKSMWMDVSGKQLYCFGTNEDKWTSPSDAFAALIDKVSGKGTWIRNPWVFAYSFKKIK